MRRLFFLLLLVPALLAAKPAPSSSIAIASGSLSLGSNLTFATTIQKLRGNEYPMVALSCYQDVNGDGAVDTTILGPDIVFSWLDRPSATFTLGGYSSIWTLRGGGDAICRADLDAYPPARVLATTGDMETTG